MQRAVDQAVEWCRIPTASFEATYTDNFSATEPAIVIDKPALANGPCLLKIVVVGAVISNQTEFETRGSHEILGPDGRWESSTNTGRSIRGNRRISSPAEVATIKTSLSQLPDSQRDIPHGPIQEGMHILSDQPQQRIESRVIVIGFQCRGVWVTRIYDKESPLPELARLLQLIHPSLQDLRQHLQDRRQRAGSPP